MDNARHRIPAAQQRQAIDGFFSKPSATGYRPASVSRPRSMPEVQVPRRRAVDGFRRSDGFHSAPRRNVQSPAGYNPSYQPQPLQHTAAAVREQTASKHRTHAAPSKVRTFKKFVFRSFALSMVLMIVAGGFLFGKGYFKIQKVFQGGSSAAALNADVDPSLLKGEGDGRVNVLMLGVGGAQHDGGDLTDTIMIASIDPVNNQAALFSIPRDLWTKMPNNYVGNYHKINAAYESGKYKYLGRQDQKNTDRKAILAGFQGVDGVVERVTGIPIHYNMLVDFKAFSQAVDTVGGIDVSAPEQLYDPTMAWENNRSPILAKKGPNHFNGKQALNYVRSRATSSDFARGERQRLMLLALKDKATTVGTLSNPVKLSNLMSAFGDNVQSDISLGDMSRMAQIMKRIPTSSIQSVSLVEPGNSFLTTGNVNGLSVVMPTAGLEDYSKIQTYIRSKLKDGYIAKENANITVLNGTARPGLATDKADELKSYGYNIGTVGNAPTDNYSKTTIVDLSGGSKKYTVNYLKKRLNVDATTTQLPQGVVAGTANIVIIIGTDETPPN